MTISFPKCKVEKRPVNDVVNSIIVAVESGMMVDNLDRNWFGQLIVYGGEGVVKAKAATFEDAAKAVASVVDDFKKYVMTELDSRRKEVESGTMVSDDKTEALQRIDTTRGKVDNSLKSGKSVIVNCIKWGEQILKITEDGGHILFRKDGTTRGKTELQNLLKKAKHDAAPKKSEMEQALDAAVHLARKMVPLTAIERKTVMSSLTSKIKEFEAEADSVEVEDTEEKVAA